ncbi:MAG: ribonuclease HII [Crocinitomicaceae bacterium]|jgi:ribonuclease HII
MSLLPFYDSKLIEAGCDEAGRGCLSGPVVAAAVILPKDYDNNLLNDSKKLTDKQRFVLKEIIEKDALSWGVAFVDNSKIDEINILNASFLAMNLAVKKLKIEPELLLIDGNRFKSEGLPYQCFVKGDGRFLSIAAASILAKTHRDLYMNILDSKYPIYKWSKNKGYPTKDHCEGIIKNGYTEYHRKTFVVKSLYQTKLDL